MSALYCSRYLPHFEYLSVNGAPNSAQICWAQKINIRAKIIFHGDSASDPPMILLRIEINKYADHISGQELAMPTST